MITRKQYLDNSAELHDSYFRQFVTPSTISFVENVFGLEKLKKSKCPHLNDVVRMTSQGWDWDRSPMNEDLAKQLGENFSDSTHTCVGKAAARIILEKAAK